MTAGIELWRPVVGWSRYLVSDVGRVWTLLSDRELVPEYLRDNRMRVRLSCDGHAPHVLVHHLVLEAFVGPRPDGLLGRHLNGDVWHNAPANLEWSTASENMLDRVKHGQHSYASRVRCPLGHRLISPNLVPAALKRGGRNCLACDRARSYVSWMRRVRGVVLDLEPLAHEHYQKLTGSELSAAAVTS